MSGEGSTIAKVNPIQESFAAGEISPKLLGRRTIEGYRSGVAEMTNFIADSRGPAIGRQGFVFSGRFAGNDARVIAGAGRGTSRRMILLTDQLLTVVSLFGFLPNINYVVNPSFTQGGLGWTSFVDGSGSQVIFNIGDVVIENGGGGGGNRTAYITQNVTANDPGVHKLIVSTNGNATYRIRVGSAPNLGDYYEIITQDVEHAADVTIPGTTAWVTIEMDRDNVSGGAAANITVRSIVLTDDVAGVSFTTPWLEEELRDIHFIASPDGNSIYFTHPFHPVQKLVHDGIADTYTFLEVAFVMPPADWTATSNPGTGTVFEGRLWLGGSPTSPQTFWASKAGDIEDFTTGNNADDALEFTMSNFGVILWMIGTKNLLIGTANAEYVISAESGVITPTDVVVDRQSAYGSARVQPIQVGDQVMYVSPDRTKLRALQYEWSADNWLSKDLTFFSEHITKGGIKDMAWAQHPNNLLICILEDGTAAWLSYERGENVWGWHKHTTQGKYKDATSASDGGVSLIIQLTQHEPGFLDLESTVSTQPRFLDSYVNKSVTPAFTVLDGLEHLEGKTVQVVADDAVHPERVVVGGQITLQAPAFSAYAGLQYTPKLVTLPLESGAQTGSSLAHLKRYNNLIIGLLDSALPLINGVRPPTRTPSTPMNTVEPNKTGQVSAYQLGWSEGAVVTIEMDLPLACTVLYIGGELPQDVL